MLSGTQLAIANMILGYFLFRIIEAGIKTLILKIPSKEKKDE